MKRVFLLIVVPALLVALGFAQTPAASGNTDLTIKGCLGGSDGNYTVAEDNTGKIFKITTSSADLKPHLGQGVTLIGHKADAAENSLAVTEVNMISEHCTAAAAAPAATVSAPSETVIAPVAAAAPAAAAPDATVSTLRSCRRRCTCRRCTRCDCQHAPADELSAQLLLLPHQPLHQMRLSARSGFRDCQHTSSRSRSAAPAAAPDATVSEPSETASATRCGRRCSPNAAVSPSSGNRQQRPLPRLHPRSRSAHLPRARFYPPSLRPAFGDRQHACCTCCSGSKGFHKPVRRDASSCCRGGAPDRRRGPSLQPVEKTKTFGADERPKSLFYEGSKIRSGQERHDRRA